MTDAPSGGLHCASCAKSLDERSAFRLRSGTRTVWKCTRCSYIDRALLARSACVAAVVGSALSVLVADYLLAILLFQIIFKK